MADEQTPAAPAAPEAPAAPAAPAFDVDALASQVTERLKAEFQRAPAPAPAPAPRQPEPGADPVGDLVRPYVAPVAQRAALAEAMATDAIEFYGNHPDLDKEERAEIERRSRLMRENGVPFKREDIYNHYLGETFDKQVEKRAAKRQRDLDRAAGQGTVGGGSPDKAGAGNIRDAASMSTDELGKALAGSSF